MTNIYNLFKFIENKEGYKTPLEYKVLNDLSSITPDDLIVNGDLNLTNRKIAKLPDNLTVRGDLYLTRASITKLPDNLAVGRDLFVSRTKITELPDNLKVGGNLHASYTKINSLPVNLNIGRDLTLMDTPMSRKYTEDQLKQMLPGVKGNIFF